MVQNESLVSCMIGWTVLQTLMDMVCLFGWLYEEVINRKLFCGSDYFFIDCFMIPNLAMPILLGMSGLSHTV